MKSFKEVFAEALALDKVNKNPGKYGCTVFMGRMQPPTSAHIKIIDDAVRQYKQPVVVAVVKASGDQSPFPFKLVKDILQKSCKQKPRVIELKTGFIGDFISPLRDVGFEPYYLLAGTDRVKNYQGQVKRYEEMFNLSLTVEEIRRRNDDISATKVRQALLDDDEGVFQSMTAPGTHKFYKKLKRLMK